MISLLLSILLVSYSEIRTGQPSSDQERAIAGYSAPQGAATKHLETESSIVACRQRVRSPYVALELPRERLFTSTQIGDFDGDGTMDVALMVMRNKNGKGYRGLGFCLSSRPREVEIVGAGDPPRIWEDREEWPDLDAYRSLEFDQWEVVLKREHLRCLSDAEEALLREEGRKRPDYLGDTVLLIWNNEGAIELFWDGQRMMANASNLASLSY